MKEQEMVGEIEVEGMEMIDLGDARDETRQWHPIQSVQDGPITWGLPILE